VPRPRKYKTPKEARHAYYVRHRDRLKKKGGISSHNGHRNAAGGNGADRVPSLKGLLVDAARWNVDREADVAPIQALLALGCDLEADILPTVARLVPDLPRPLKNWGAKWLVQALTASAYLCHASFTCVAPLFEEIALMRRPDMIRTTKTLT
jgi:hypothetical protein